jgi:hypothetical protein
MTPKKKEENTIKFNVGQPPTEMIKLAKGKFYFQGEEVKDKHQVYERFYEWITIAEKDSK